MLFVEYDDGGGFLLLHSAANRSVREPVIVQVFLLQESNSTAGHRGTLDDLVIKAEDLRAFCEICEGDSDRDSRVTVDELVRGVGNALDGCPTFAP